MTSDDGTDLSVEPFDRRAEWAARRPPAASDDGPDRAERRAERARRRRRRMGVLAVSGVLALAIVAAGGWFVWELDPPGDAGRAVIVEIQPGWGTKEAGDALQHDGVIGSSLAFQIWFKVSNAGSFQAGTYALHRHLGVRAAAAALARGPSPTAVAARHLALPPGLRLEQIADRVGRLPGHNRDAFLQLARSGSVRSKYQGTQVSVEGFTWPDTYFIGKNESDGEILTTIVGEFDQHADRVHLSGAIALGLSPQQVVVVASLVQAEAGTKDDAPKVAAVILNRYRRGIQLQIDATLCYAKGGCPPVPSNADKQIDSPYNTYRATGLPPTPIMTVTEQALSAALQPANAPYLFYVTGKDGVTYFATTPAEHQRNIAEHGVRGE
ncbi:MAG TPA: endolytic transglycosylase MltG [Acidimicrobiia bacterium]